MRIERQTFPLRRSCGNDERRRFLRIQSRSIWKHPDETDWKHLLPPLIRKTPSCCRVVYALQNAESRNSSCASAPRDNQVRRWRRKDSPSKAVAGNPSTKAATDGRHLAIVRKIFGAQSANELLNPLNGKPNEVSEAATSTITATPRGPRPKRQGRPPGRGRPATTRESRQKSRSHSARDGCGQRP